ncbi:Ribonuclease hii, partial [Globisporangium splendens]
MRHTAAQLLRCSVRLLPVAIVTRALMGSKETPTVVRAVGTRRSARLAAASLAANSTGATARGFCTTRAEAEGDAAADDADASDLGAKRKKRKTAVKAPAPTADDLVDANDSGENPSAVKFPHGTLSRAFEAAKVAKGYKTVVGVDEAGRGPLAGPVVAAACYVPLDVVIEGVHDSKKLNEEQREALYELLTSHPRIQYAVHINSAQRIDEINILQASLESMVKASEALAQKPDFVFVDGNRMPPTITVDAETVVKGDSKVYSIAAASIIAKVTRDRLMVEYDAQYPQYNLKQHKGYPTRDHMAAIAKHGPCEIHRMTFAPLKPKENKKKTTKKAKAPKIAK